MTDSSHLLGRAAACRELASRARHVASNMIGGADRERLLRYGDNLDGQATDLERQATQATDE